MIDAIKNSGILFANKDKPKLILPRDLYKEHLCKEGGNYLLPAEFAKKIVLDSIHTGKCIPGDIAKKVSSTKLLRHYRIERDWGADLVAKDLAHMLGISWYEVQIARVLQDIGRFSGDTITGNDGSVRDHLLRKSTNYPFTEVSKHEKFPLLALYDQISDAMEKILKEIVLRISIHTCDYRDSKGVRPEFMLLYTLRDVILNLDNPLPNIPFLPLEIARQTVDPCLVGFLSKELHCMPRSFQTTHNYPYQLSEGGVETRLLAWWMSQLLQKEFETDNPKFRVEDSSILNKKQKNWEYLVCWAVLQDTNGRNANTHIWRHFLLEDLSIRDLSSIDVTEEQIKRVSIALDRIKKYYKNNKHKLIQKFWREKLGTIAIEIRKDVAMDDKKREVVVRTLAKAIFEYVEILLSRF